MIDAFLDWFASPARGRLLEYAVYLAGAIQLVWFVAETYYRVKEKRAYEQYRSQRIRASAEAMSKHNVLRGFLHAGGWGTADKIRRYDEFMVVAMEEANRHGAQYAHQYAMGVQSAEVELAKVLNWYIKAEAFKNEPR